MAAILIIEGKDVVRAMLGELLERAGHEVLEASQGLEGIRQYPLLLTELVITDIQLPDCDGLEVIVTLRHEYRALKILAISAHSGKEEMLIMSKLLGADAIVQDPFDGEGMLRAVNDLLGGT